MFQLAAAALSRKIKQVLALKVAPVRNVCVVARLARSFGYVLRLAHPFPCRAHRGSARPVPVPCQRNGNTVEICFRVCLLLGGAADNVC